uniref:Cytochrome b n=1 Tax=Macracanthorhynchus hirudinaceus TaxID=1032456 RepID=K3W3Y6_MACHR|nr:cytochrome b [Macracanthorhynchus hirudinaceus]CCA94495.2 cytochrome b [Macracanthorhynchus hirudinaceus]
MKSMKLYYGVVDNFLFSLPVPVSINYLWGVGSMLGMCLVVQLISGFVLSLFYSCGAGVSFASVVSIMMDVNYGWVVRYVHSSGASLMMLLVYMHVFRGLWHGSFKLASVWLVGVLIVLGLSMVSFLGYVLPWGQMSFWAATVITSMVTAVPYVGSMLSWWLWGSFSVGDSTLIRFFSFHYMLSLLIVVLVVVHLINLHESGSSNPVGCPSKLDMLSFHVLYSYKDIWGIVGLVWLYVIFVLMDPFMVLDSVNFEECSFVKTPSHIKPEWYFLYAYCVLRSIASKMGGVVMMVLSMVILILFSVPCRYSVGSYSAVWGSGAAVWVLVWSFVGLTFLGGRVVEFPFEMMGKFMTFSYFTSVFMMTLLIYWQGTVK